MKQTLKTLGIFLCTLYTVCATQSGEAEIKTPTAPMTSKLPQFPNIEDENLLPAAPKSSPIELSLSIPLASSNHKNAIIEFITGFSTVWSTISTEHAQNVHNFDSFMEANIPTRLLKTLQELNIGDNTLTKEQIIAMLKDKTPDELRYEDKRVSKATVHKYIDLCVTQAFTNPQTQELFSRYIMVLTDMNDQDYNNTLLNSITENYETKGGCWAGVRNRCAISFAYIIAHKIGAL
ncbi:MAG TPA: hypothetical protein DIC42_04020 [Holosporales bacterium]|nr:hypothetical protein [Holosporales bacterium]